MRLTHAVHKTAIGLMIAVPLSLLVPSVVHGGDLQPPGPPAPTMRTLDSLGFDCPADVANNTTNLLYTFVTNTNGFDTGFSISNTSTDPFGTTPQAGSCTLNFYGGGAPPQISTGNVASGATYANTASIIAPGFQGYMIAVCNFSYAHGFAFISDLGARNLAMGYLAQNICTDRKPNASSGAR